MTDRPQPKPGILDISPYKPGKAAVEGVAQPLKLSANENILGSSPEAKTAFASAIDELHLYPDGRCNAL
ncbi:MAG: histidinol-phosphate transaminase, partial [Phenylobacterium sp.]|nr:histidinol-phosphate transaminase [Phenylobacterium sp.]